MRIRSQFPCPQKQQVCLKLLCTMVKTATKPKRRQVHGEISDHWNGDKPKRRHCHTVRTRKKVIRRGQLITFKVYSQACMHHSAPLFHVTHLYPRRGAILLDLRVGTLLEEEEQHSSLMFRTACWSWVEFISVILRVAQVINISGPKTVRFPLPDVPFVCTIYVPLLQPAFTIGWNVLRLKANRTQLSLT